MVNYLSAFTDMIGPLFAPHIIILLPGVASQKKIACGCAAERLAVLAWRWYDRDVLIFRFIDTPCLRTSPRISGGFCVSYYWHLQSVSAMIGV